MPDGLGVEDWGWRTGGGGMGKVDERERKIQASSYGMIKSWV